MNVFWTLRARSRLKLIRDYLIAEAPMVADRTIGRLVNCFRQIGELPYSGRQVPEYRQNDLREILERPYRILYRIRVDRIDIITVIHYRQLLPSDLKELLK
jgi:plasmid stabilization system protein ParE